MEGWIEEGVGVVQSQVVGGGIVDGILENVEGNVKVEVGVNDIQSSPELKEPPLIKMEPLTEAKESPRRNSASYPSPGKNLLTNTTTAPKIMVFRPTFEEFKDFRKYIKYMEEMGGEWVCLDNFIVS